MNRKPIKVAVVGCGAVSDVYFQNMTRQFDGLTVVSCCANHIESAERQGNKYGVTPQRFEEILDDPEIDLVVVLTPAPTHYQLIRQALLAGKHVYTEKPLTTSLDEAKELLRLADEKQRYLGAAPETFLGSGLQTARKAIDDGMIGDVTSFHVVANRDITMLASIFKFLRQPGGGICFDYGVYYLTALVSLLGPFQQVFAKVGNRQKVRENIFPQSPEFGTKYTYDNESLVNAILTTEQGVTGTLSLNGDSVLKDQAYFSIHGTKGILQLGDANQLGGDVLLIPNDPKAFSEVIPPIALDPVSTINYNARGIGPAEMALAIQSGTRSRVSGEMAFHVLDTMIQIMRSGETNELLPISSTCERPEPFDVWQRIYY